jgi:hypothetical protein
MSETGSWCRPGDLRVWCRPGHVAARSAALNDSSRLHQLIREGSPELPRYRHSAQMRPLLVLVL